MMYSISKKILSLFILAAVALSASAQQKLTREQILAMTTDELSELPLEDLMEAVETLGVSSVDELFALIMNKNVSSASKQEENTFTSPLSTTVITYDEMRTYGVTTIEEAFRLIPGMIVAEKTNGIYDIQMRGLINIPDNNMLLYTENANTLVLIDGRPVNNLTMGAVNFDMLPIDIEDVDRIEVVRGAASALYGSNAVTGVINILTKKPDSATATVSGNVQLGNDNTYIGNVAIRKAVNSKFAVGLTLSMQHRDRPTDELYVIPASGVYMANTGAPEVRNAFTQEQLMDYILSGALTDMSAGGYVRPSRLEDLKQLYPDNGMYVLYNCLEPESPSSSMFENSALARQSEGYNAYLTFTPTSDIRFDLTAGYQRSYANTTPVGDDYFSFNGRQSKTGYVALSAAIKDLKILANYSGGPQNYAVGVPGFKTKTSNLNVSAEYDINVGSLLIRPGLAFQQIYYEDYVPDYDDLSKGYSWTNHDPGYKYDPNNNNHLSGFFNYDAKVKSFAPYIRLDYRVNGFRFIGAYRAEKTNIPDKFHHSWQLSANYSINDNNFIRLVYGRANRSAVMVNSNANFQWTRSTLMAPNYLQFSSDPEADLVKTDNFEIGYRVKPSPKLLIDAEAFYSRSTDFGSLQANTGVIRVDKSAAADYLSGAMNLGQLISSLKTYASIKYTVLPYKVNQFGISFNVDWIISEKLIAKLNANIQKTLIDDYYQYSQTQVIQELLTRSKSRLMGEMMQVIAQQQAVMGNNSLSDEQKAEQLKKIAEATLVRLESEFSNDKLGTYDVGATSADQIREQIKNGTLDLTDEANRRLARNFGSEPEDGVESKATPHFYGMLGLIYKPFEKFNASLFTNYIGPRTYATKYNSNGEKLSQRFTVNLKLAYSPAENVEFFLNGHNLLNTKKREFVYCDEIPGIYTVGLNFKF